MKFYDLHTRAPLCSVVVSAVPTVVGGVKCGGRFAVPAAIALIRCRPAPLLEEESYDSTCPCSLRLFPRSLG